MNAIGIIAEYNPFHRGHAYQLRELRRMYPDAGGIVVMMSGSFTQRGTMSVLDKWMRARHAVIGGADLVLELPFVFACRSAQDFARGGVSLLAALGIANRLAFGAETADLTLLKKTAALINAPSVQERLHAQIDAGASYAAALTRALASEHIPEELLRAPNNILALEYLRALRRIAPEIAPVALARRTAAHNDTALHPGITSASSIRTALTREPPPWNTLGAGVPPQVYGDLCAAHAAGLPDENRLLILLRYAFLRTPLDAIRECCGVTEGIEHRLARALNEAHNYDDLRAATAAKRYPRSRIARLVTHILLHFTKKQAARCDACGAAYIRPLALNERGQKLLRAIKERTALPIVTRTAQFLTSAERASPKNLSPIQEMLAFDTWATELRLLTMPTRLAAHTDFITSPCVIPSIPKG